MNKSDFLRKVIIVLTILTAIISLSGCSFKRKINLNKYISINSEGYDNFGDAYYTFDYEKFEEDYAGKIKLTENNKNTESIYSLFGYEDKETIEEKLMNDCVQLYFDKNHNLKNGDSITLKAIIDDAIALEYYNVELQFDDIDYNVNNLKKVSEFDPFEYIDIEFTGVAPKGEIKISANYEIPEMQYINITYENISNTDACNNGDSIVVKVQEYNSQENFVSEFGETIIKREKTFTVSGLKEYLNDSSLITDDLYNSMEKELMDYFYAHKAQKWNKDSVLNDIHLDRLYLLNQKSGKQLDYSNRLYFLYEVNVTCSDNENFTYYWWGQFTNLIVNKDGTIEIDLNNYMKSESSSGFFENSGDYLKLCKYHYVAGFETIEDFENSLIISKLEDYTYKKYMR